MNWGKGIFIVLGLFIGFITVLVTILISQKVDLVSDDYYMQEVEYQSEINKQQEGLLHEKIKVSQLDKHIVVQLPLSIETKDVNVSFQRPNDNELDRNYTFSNSKSYLIPLEDFEKGEYSIRAQFAVGSEDVVQKLELTVK